MDRFIFLGMVHTGLKLSRLYVRIIGCVQGVGFRPQVYRLAVESGLVGFVRNCGSGVEIEVEGPVASLEQFLARVVHEHPANSAIYSLETRWLDPVGYTDFKIVASNAAVSSEIGLLPDLATCQACLSELFDPSDRRYRYPFINCTHCGPRYSIIERLPYDRINTSMNRFAMCENCEVEYRNSADRRFHAEPIACPKCGPQVTLVDAEGMELAKGEQAIKKTCELLKQGKILAVKGLGGFHLMVKAGQDEPVRLLRIRKRRELKPFAVMFPNLESIRAVCEIGEAEERSLTSVSAPIVLVRRKPNPSIHISYEVAPGNPYLGVMLPYTPLHHLLLYEVGEPLVATSGNLSNEPICIDQLDAIERLRGVADAFLVHDRPIVRHVDDSVVQVINGREVILRRARGYAPLSVPVGIALDGTQVGILALGAHQKSAIAVSEGRRIYLGQHIGDLDTELSAQTFARVIEDLCDLYHLKPQLVVCDLHPGYYSTKYAEEYSRVKGARILRVQHHLAHVLGCVHENEAPLPVLGVAWDGTGYGTDGTVWGGEFLLVHPDWVVERVGTIKPFRLIGGEKAVKEPRRVAFALLCECFGSNSSIKMLCGNRFGGFTKQELELMDQLRRQGVNSPVCTSIGRLFDGVASILEVCHINAYEGQAAMQLEFCADWNSSMAPYEFEMLPHDNVGKLVDTDGRLIPRDATRVWEIDWRPLIQQIISEYEMGVSVSKISFRFHVTLVEMIRKMAKLVGVNRVALAGGCFQNRLLIALALKTLEAEGISVYHSQRVPPNDGGIAFGQIVAVLHSLR